MIVKLHLTSMSPFHSFVSPDFLNFYPQRVLWFFVCHKNPLAPEGFCWLVIKGTDVKSFPWAAELAPWEHAALARAAADLEQRRWLQHSTPMLWGAEFGPLTGNSRTVWGFFAVKLSWKWMALTPPYFPGLARIYSSWVAVEQLWLPLA